MSRRKFLAYLGAGLASMLGLALWSTTRVARDSMASDESDARVGPRDGNATPPAAEDLLVSVSDRDSTVMVGKIYLDAQTRSLDDASLRSQIWGGVVSAYAARTTRLEGSGPEELEQGIEWAVQDDFHANRVVSVDGWILAKTEANLAALAALRAEPATPA